MSERVSYRVASLAELSRIGAGAWSSWKTTSLARVLRGPAWIEIDGRRYDVAYAVEFEFAPPSPHEAPLALESGDLRVVVERPRRVHMQG